MTEEEYQEWKHLVLENVDFGKENAVSIKKLGKRFIELSKKDDTYSEFRFTKETGLVVDWYFTDKFYLFFIKTSEEKENRLQGTKRYLKGLTNKEEIRKTKEYIKNLEKLATDDEIVDEINKIRNL